MEPEDEISSLKQLWEVLYRRMPGTHYTPIEQTLPHPFDYYGGKSCRNLEWEPENGLEDSKVCGILLDRTISPGWLCMG